MKRIVVASSDKAYGDQEILPYQEDAPLIGRFPYDCSKSCTDLISISYHRSYQTPVCITRCGNLFGAGDLNWNRIVPGTIRSILRGQAPVIRSDGKFVRDYFYVGDAVDSYLKLAEQLEKPGIVGEAFNFSHELPMNVLELVDTIIRLMDSNLKPEVLNQAQNEIREQYLSSEKAKSLLTDWAPKFGLEEGLRRTIGWYRELLS